MCSRSIAKADKFHLYSMCGHCVRFLTAADLMLHGIPRSTAYRAVKTGSLPMSRVRLLQFRVFGELPGWQGWRILPGKLIDPDGNEYTPGDLEAMAYLQRVMDWN